MQKNCFPNFVILILCGGSKFFVRVYSISKSTGRRILIFKPIDSETQVSYLSIIHFDTLTPLFFELSSKIKKIRNFARFLLESHKIAH